MRLIVEAHDYDEALAFYREALGADEELQIHSLEGEHVTILQVGRATLELSNPAQVAMIDRVEVGHRVSPHLRVAFEVQDAAKVTDDLVEAGAALLAAPTLTPWGSLNARLDALGIFRSPFSRNSTIPCPLARDGRLRAACGTGSNLWWRDTVAGAAPREQCRTRPARCPRPCESCSWGSTVNR
jgi:uncharacterized glyoxalase superfamily protein PhnB